MGHYLIMNVNIVDLSKKGVDERNMPKVPPQDTAMPVQSLTNTISLKGTEAAHVAHGANHIPGPMMILIKKRPLEEYAVKLDSSNMIFNPINKGTVCGEVVALNDECKPWYKKNCSPGTLVMFSEMTGAFTTFNGVDHVFVYEHDIRSVLKPI